MVPESCCVALLSVGRPQPILGPNGDRFTSSIGRRPVDRPVRLLFEGLEGDACAYAGHHGEYMRVNAFCAAHYGAAEAFAGKALPRPGFGENLTLEGLTEADVRVGDVLRAGGAAMMQVTQPREPCANVPRFLGVPDMMKWMLAEPATGFYLRVVEPGAIAPGDTLHFEAHGPAEWTITRLNRALYHDAEDFETIERLLELPELSPRWKESLRQHTERRRARLARQRLLEGDAR
jgi:MOSC domain-containing protein YiiM